MRGSGLRCTACAAGARTGAGAGAGVPFRAGAAAPGRRKPPQAYEWPSVVVSVVNARSVLLDNDMINLLLCFC